jgi:hypothetical protein
MNDILHSLVLPSICLLSLLCTTYTLSEPGHLPPEQLSLKPCVFLANRSSPPLFSSSCSFCTQETPQGSRFQFSLWEEFESAVPGGRSRNLARGGQHLLTLDREAVTMVLEASMVISVVT